MNNKFKEFENFLKRRKYKGFELTADENQFGVFIVEFANIKSSKHTKMLYRSNKHNNNHSDYVKNNFEKFKEIFDIKDFMNEVFNINQMWSEYETWTTCEHGDKRREKLQNTFYNFMKATIEKNEMKEVINSNCGVNKVKRKKRVM